MKTNQAVSTPTQLIAALLVLLFFVCGLLVIIAIGISAYAAIYYQGMIELNHNATIINYITSATLAAIIAHKIGGSLVQNAKNFAKLAIIAGVLLVLGIIFYTIIRALIVATMMLLPANTMQQVAVTQYTKRFLNPTHAITHGRVFYSYEIFAVEQLDNGKARRIKLINYNAQISKLQHGDRLTLTYNYNKLGKYITKINDSTQQLIITPQNFPSHSMLNWLLHSCPIKTPNAVRRDS